MRRGRWWRRAAALAAVGLALGAAGWAAGTYVRLVRLEVAVDDRCARAEAAAHTLVDLADNLLLDPCLSGPELERVRAARAAADAPALSAECGTTAGDAGELRGPRLQLAATLAALSGAGRAAETAEARGILAAFGARLARAEAGLGDALDEVDAALGAYRVAASRFPATVVAPFTERASPPRVAIARSHAAALVPSGR